MTTKIMKILARIADRDAGAVYTAKKKSPLQRVSPSLRLLAALWCVLLCAASRNAVFLLIILAVQLLRLAFLPGQSLLRVLGAIVPPVLFSIFIMLPAVFLGHPRTMLTIALKILTSMSVLSLLGESLSWQEITASFQSLHVPQLFVLTLDMTVRFLVVLGRLCQNMSEAVTLRTVSDRGKQYDRARMTAAGGILGSVFLHAGEMSVEVSEAMECRCFDGTFRSFRRERPGPADFVYFLILPALTAVFFYMNRG